MITAQQAREKCLSKLPTIETMIPKISREILGQSVAGYHWCKPFTYYKIKYSSWIEQEEYDKEELKIIQSRIKQVIKYLEQQGYSIHVPKTIIRRKPKYEKTIIRW